MANIVSTDVLDSILSRVLSHTKSVFSQKGNLHPDLTVSITSTRKPNSLTGDVTITTERDGNTDRVDSFVVFLMDDNLYTYTVFANTPERQDATDDVWHEDVRSSVLTGRAWAEEVMTDLAA